MRAEGLRAQVGYGRKPRFHGGTPRKAAANLLDRQFDVTEPDTAWASDFTFIRTHEGWMYLAVVIDLFSRQVIGWAMRDRADTELVVQALLSAAWRRKNPTLVAWFTRTKGRSTPAMTGRVSWRPMAWCAA